MSAPLLWIFVPLAGSLLVYLFRNISPAFRWILFGLTLLLFISALVVRTFPSGAISSNLSIVSDINVLGRVLSISENIRPLVAILFAFTVLWGLFSLISSENIIHPALRLAGTALLIASLAVKPTLYAALMVEAAIITFILLLLLSSNGNMRGTRLLLALSSIAMPLFLLIGWQLTGGNIAPVDDNQLQIAVNVISFSFMLWLGIFPFNAWLSMISREHSPLDVTFFFTIFSTSILLLFMQSLYAFSWFKQFPSVMPSIRLLGLIMLIVNSLPLAVNPFKRESMGRWSGFSIGLILLSIGINTTESIRMAVYVLITRGVALYGLGDYFSQNPKYPDAQTWVSIPALDWFEHVISVGGLVGIPLFSVFPVLFLLPSLLNSIDPLLSWTFLFAIGFAWIAWGKIVGSVPDFKINTTYTWQRGLTVLPVIVLLLLTALFPNIVLWFSEKIVSSFSILV